MALRKKSLQSAGMEWALSDNDGWSDMDCSEVGCSDKWDVGALPPMPYWVWVCMMTGPERALYAGELLMVLLDRLADYGMPTEGITQAMLDLAEESKIGELEAAILVQGRGDAGHERLWKLSSSLPGLLAEAAEQCEAEFVHFRQQFGELVYKFREGLRNNHPAFFERGAWPGPINLGGMVACVEWLVQMEKWFHEPDDVRLARLPKAWPKSLPLWLDWNGDYPWIAEDYWREELKQIMGGI